MNILLRKCLTDLALLGALPLLRIVTSFDDWNNSIGASIGESAFGSDLNEFLLGYSEPPIGPWYTQSFTWCYYLPLLALILYYHVIDKGRYRGTVYWFGVLLASAFTCAVVAYGIVENNDGLVPSLAQVGFMPRFIWGLFNLLLAALLGTLFSFALAPAAVNTRLTPFGR